MSVIFSDTFTDTDSTAIGSHDPDVGGGVGAWVMQGVQAIEIQSNKAKYLSGSGFAFAAADTSDADVQVEVDIAIPNAANYSYGVVVRLADVSNYWLIDVVRVSSGNPGMRLIRVESAGLNVENEDTNVGAVSGTTVNVRVVCSGNTITGYLDDVQKVTYGSASFQSTATKHGISVYADYDNTGTFDNFSVDSDPVVASFVPAIINKIIRGGGYVR